ncbi:MAG: hypothetical protein V5783_04250 [Pontiella sp.]
MATKRKMTHKKMKKNHVQVPFPVLLANVLVLVAVLGLSYMWLCSRCDALGKDIKEKEVERNAAQKRLVNEQDRWSSITSPANLERALKQYNLAMVMPRESQVVHVGNWNGNRATAMYKTDVAADFKSIRNR